MDKLIAALNSEFMDHRTKPGDRSALRRTNMRTAMILLGIAALFFVGVFAARILGGEGSRGILGLGVVVVIFLIVAIGRNLRSKE